MFEIQIFEKNWFCFNFGKINFVKNRLPCLNMKITHRAFFEKIIIMRSKKKLKTECWNIGSRESGACLMKTLVPAYFAYELFFLEKQINVDDYKQRTQNMYDLLYAGQISVDTKEQFQYRYEFFKPSKLTDKF